MRRSRLPEDEISAARLPGRTLVSLASVSDDDLGDELTVVWEIVPGRGRACHPAARGYREDSDVLHTAACHACLFASETSCEANNRWLDRAVLVEPTGGGLVFPG